ncbi:MAG: polysaccharide deacetylase family protein [Oscillospiraceae bacterium]|nr:polysaccharide deacetylase family protein [Oscillospiraceae bacterium]
MYKTLSFKKAVLLVMVFGAAIALIVWALWSLGMDISQIVSGERLVPIYSVETQRKAVALGINCAWEDEDIPQILNTLEKYNAKATFFVVGEWCSRCPDSLKKIYDAGQEIGSHSDTHPDMSVLNEAEIAEELDGCAEKIAAVTGDKPLLFRPPSGAYSNTLIKTAKEMGYYTVQWSVDSIDWKGLTAEEIFERVTAKTKSGDIILLHSGADHTAEALPAILEKLTADGFELVPVSELIYLENYTIDHAGRQHPMN